MFERPMVQRLRAALPRLPQLIHVLIGPRQVGKTTAAKAVAAGWDGPVRYAAADELWPPDPEWLRQQFRLARAEVSSRKPLLILDEIQKVPGWSEVIKGEWDAEPQTAPRLSVLVLGSSALLLGRGTTESLAGRFFLHRCPHWSYGEARSAFGWTLEQWLFFGGYPGAAALADDIDLWRGYVRDSLVEAVLARDVLSLERVTKPALLRHLFALSCRYAGQSLSYNKMLGQLQDAGNTTTLAHYLALLQQAFLVTGLEKFASGRGRTRGSTPKLVLWNNALVSAVDLRSPAEARADGGHWGRLVENAVGGHLLNLAGDGNYEVSWWRERDQEVDFVVAGGAKVWAIEVKSGRPQKAAGLEAFKRRHPQAIPLLVGAGGLALEEFFSLDPKQLLAAL